MVRRGVFLVLALLTLALPLAAQSPETDADIATSLREVLREIGGYDDVTVTVNEGVVTFRGTANSLTEAEALEGLASRVDGVLTVRNEVTETAEIGRRLTPAIDRFKARVSQMLVAMPLLLIAGVVFLAIFTLGLLIARLRQPWDRLSPNAFIADILRQMVRIVFAVIGLVVALDILNATALLSTFLGAAGLIGLAIGFAVRDTVENFLASVMLSLRQPFQPHDVVSIAGDEGKVIRLTSRATILLDYDGNHVRIPNAAVFKSKIVNFTRNPERRFVFDIGVAPDADLSAVQQLADEVVGKLPYTLDDPAPKVWVDRIGDGAVFLTVTGWIDQRLSNPASARGEAIRAVKDAVEAAGIDVPDTTYRIQLAGGGLEATVDAEPATPAPRPHPARAQEPDTAADTSLDRIVQQERADDDSPDLLKENGPEE